MNTPMSWIKAYVPDLDVTAQEYTDAMTLSGTKVEGFDRLDAHLEKIIHFHFSSLYVPCLSHDPAQIIPMSLPKPTHVSNGFHELKSHFHCAEKSCCQTWHA